MEICSGRFFCYVTYIVVAVLTLPSRSDGLMHLTVTYLW